MKLHDIKPQPHRNIKISEQSGSRQTLDVYSPQMISKALHELESKLRTTQAFIARLKDTKEDDPEAWRELGYQDQYQKEKQHAEDLQQQIAVLKQKQKNVLDTGDIDNLWQQIKQQCSIYLSACAKTGGFLYRGIMEQASVFVAHSPENRKPLDSSPAITASFDKSLEIMGFTARRQNSIFAISDSLTAASFGTCYVIFPKNGFEFTYTDSRELVLDELDLVVSNQKQELWMRQVLEVIRESPEKYPMLSGLPGVSIQRMYNLIQANANMLASQGFPRQLLEPLVDPQFVFREYHPNRTNLSGAIASGREVYVHGEYFALKTQWWKETLTMWMREIQNRPLTEQIQDTQQEKFGPTLVPITTELDKYRAAVNRIEQHIKDLQSQGEKQQAQAVENNLAVFSQKIRNPDLENMPLTTRLTGEISEKCSDILQIYKQTQGFLYHGSKKLSALTYQGESLENRRAKDSDLAVSTAFNWCLAKLGFAARRDNSIFATSDHLRAFGDYGPLYVVLPWNNQFHYTYTSRQDLVLTPQMLWHFINQDKANDLLQAWKKLDLDNQQKIIIYPQSRSNALDLVYWLIEHQNARSSLAKLSQLTGLSSQWQDYIDVVRFQDRFQPRKDNLEIAIDKGAEVYITGKFYLLKVDRYHTAFSWWPILESIIKKS